MRDFFDGVTGWQPTVRVEPPYLRWIGRRDRCPNTTLALIQNAADRRGGADLVYFVFDLLYLDGRKLMLLPLADRKNGLAALLERREDAVRFSEHQVGQGPKFHRHACELGLEGIVSKRLDAPYSPGDRGLRVKTKCLNREEFVVVGWTDPEGSRSFTGALLLGHYDPAGRLIYAGRVGTGMRANQLEELLRRLRPLQIGAMPLDTHRVRPGSARRWFSRGCIGSGPSSSSKSNI